MGFVAGLFVNGALTPDHWTSAHAVCERLEHLSRESCLIRVGPPELEGLFSAEALDIGLSGEDGSRWAVAFDGSITNASALGRSLRDAGHYWSGKLSAGLVLDAWRAWGADMLPRLQGSFAFALFDPTSQSVICARDRWGRRPLFYACADRGFAFASELQALLLWPGVRRVPDYDVIATIMSLGHPTVDRAPFEGVHRVPPGHMLVRRADGEVTISPWSRWPLQASTPDQTAEIGREFRRRLDHAVSSALGGSDAAEVIGGGFPGITLEASASRFSAKTRCATPEPLHPHAQLRAITRMLWHQGEPLVHTAGLDLHTRLLMADAPVLTTAGGAELQLSHAHYAAFAQRLAKLDDNGENLGWTGGYWPVGPLKRDLYHAATGLMTEAERLSLCGPGLIHTALFATPDLFGPALEAATPETAPELASQLDIAFRLPALDLAVLGAAEAATGIRAACPFLDDELADWCLGISAGARRAIWREFVPGAGALLPSRSAGRQNESLPARGIQQLAGEILLDRKCLQRGAFARSGVERLVQTCLNGDLRQVRTLWALLCIELWFVDFIDEPPRPPGVPRKLAAHSAAPIEMKH